MLDKWKTINDKYGESSRELKRMEEKQKFIVIRQN